MRYIIIPCMALLALVFATPQIPSPNTSVAAPNSSSSPVAPVPDETYCECGYTYCASVLMAMKKAWSTKQLAEAYCTTPSAVCGNGKPSTSVNTALYICLCDDPGQKYGNKLDLLCACDKCLVVGPDFRGRCETPCHSGQCKA
ncbi:uncharacterized protein UV8b_07089 [Ustilaginoidea virens]|uniref:Uncharacterized protein n=1 Tax=Ustilaginoidea virens TaxID=1159556 RepID=A0A8E5MJQ1_USTVR|nr:uncharacterized protein UV8b_07089 [Ustilaginoidea virens]QUC22848.1 hypothetical protein UV8b_07089 [Ustilaginoidea virens]